MVHTFCCENILKLSENITKTTVMSMLAFSHWVTDAPLVNLIYTIINYVLRSTKSINFFIPQKYFNSPYIIISSFVLNLLSERNKCNKQ